MIKNIKGQRFGKLVAIEVVGSEKKGTLWLCKCDCGKEVETVASYLTSGHKTSCGCLRWQGQNASHGYSKTKFYRTWQNMKKRCDKPNAKEYENYGGRGIAYDPRWSKFENFLEDMKTGYEENLTLDRIDVNGNYCKENCRWIDMKTQANNTRTNRYIEYMGERLTASQFAEKYGLDYELFRHRINQGWSIEQAMTPVKQGELITYNGITKTVSEFALEYGFAYHQVKKRLMRGWNIERALTQPLRDW